ncbi:MAG: ATP-binding protein [Cyanobacteria bacterium J06623_4]
MLKADVENRTGRVPESPRLGRHIVLAARLGANATVLREVLAAEARVQIEPPTIEAVSVAIAQDAALVVLTEEVLTNEDLAKQLGDRISAQPSWSDIPVIILLSDCQRFGDCLALLGQTTHQRSILLLELPLKRVTFATAVQASLQNRKRQYALRDTLSQLQESNKALENFSYTAAHELRNPLGVAKTSFDLLARTSLDPKQQKLVDMGQRTTARMNQLIAALLQYSKIQTAADELTAVDMTTVVHEAVDGLQVLIAQSHADIQWGTLPTIRGNRQLLIQLISNLIKNAIVHNTTAEVPRVVISAQPASAVGPNIQFGAQLGTEAGSRPTEQFVVQPITQSDSQQANQDGLPVLSAKGRWFFFVADNGPGIAPEIQTEIFNMFNRAGKSRAEGSGIGLALCQRVAQQHKTTIGVTSEAGSGSTFYFDLDGVEDDG